MLLNFKGVNVCSVKIQLEILSVYILVKNMVEVIGFFGYSLPCLIFVPFWFLVSCGSHRAACGGWWGNEARGDRWRQVVEHVVRNDWALMR